MANEFNLTMIGTKNNCILKSKEMKLIFSGVYYAMVRDSISGRQKEYKKLLRKLNQLTGRI
jgi:hypothetical protein